MQDIDFDELDKAVGSVMSSPNPSVPADQPSASPAPATQSPSAAPQPAPAVAPSPAESPATRRSTGRFMDVVHPSSDMRNPASRSDNRPPSPEVQLEATPEAEIETLVGGMDSPFLPDAKVEKRPLGAFSETSEQTPPSSDLTAALEKELAEQPVDFTQPVQAETTSQPMTPATESGVPPTSDSTDSQPNDEVIGQPNPDDLAALEVSEEKLLESESSLQSPSVTSEEETESVETVPAEPLATPVEQSDQSSFATASIPQQYHEQPATEEQPSGAIYDTEAYHQPLAHPTKKSSSLTIILWIVGLILLGVATGALVYFFVLPQL